MKKVKVKLGKEATYGFMDEIPELGIREGDKITFTDTCVDHSEDIIESGLVEATNSLFHREVIDSIHKSKDELIVTQEIKVSNVEDSEDMDENYFEGTCPTCGQHYHDERYE